MISRSRLIAWLLWPVLAFGSAVALAEPVEGAAKALHLLDYIGADYPPTVSAGKVVDEAEYREQQEFVGTLQGLLADLPERPQRKALEEGVGALRQAINERQDGPGVARQ
ncbi:MAG TPA: cystathionine gamma-synthase, partial [Pseudomonas sp.]|nr:cystathionine gamma-synthase [Pseudomonas sp.]